MVFDSHPGSVAMGASSNLPRASAPTLSQAMICAKTAITRCIPDREADRRHAARPHRFQTGPVLSRSECAHELLDAAVTGGFAARVARSKRPPSILIFAMLLRLHCYMRAVYAAKTFFLPSRTEWAGRTRRGSTGPCRSATGSSASMGRLLNRTPGTPRRRAMVCAPGRVVV